MKKNIFKLLILVISAALCFGMVSCSELLDKLPFEIPGLSGGDNGDDNGGNGGNNGDSNLKGLVLIENKVAKFQIVYTTDGGSVVVKRAEEFVKQLRALGIEINDPISDSDKNISDCEIIIGTSVKNRDDELVVTQKELGKVGLLVKIVGQKILIAGGTADLTVDLFENYIEEEMKITKKTESIDSLAVNSDYSYVRETPYKFSSITLGGVNLKEYTLVYDLGDYVADSKGAIKTFRDDIYNVSGCWLDVGTVDKIDTYEHSFIFRYTDNAGAKGFRIFEKDGDFIVECAYTNAFEKTFLEYANKVFYHSNNNKVALPEDYLQEVDVTKVYYNDFGAKGDGTTDDYAAIRAAHEYANESGQKVYGTYGATYYIGAKTFTSAIPIFTDVDFCGAIFIVDDRGDDAFANRGNALFSLRSDTSIKKFEVKDIANDALEFDGVKVSIASGATELSWIVPYLEADISMLRIENAAHKDYVRHGSNQNAGQNRHEMILVNKDGSITEDTTVFFEYEKLTHIYIHSGDDKPLTIENGEFYNICCQASLVNDPKYGGITKYQAFARGISIGRANVTIKNLNHKMVDQPIVIDNKDDKDGSYPYGGFLSISNTYNLTVEDCVLAGHTTYYERKSATESSGGVGGADNFVAAGSYDFVFGNSTHITFNNVDQQNIDYTIDDKTHVITAENGGYDNGIGDNRYWGIMCSNFVKNLKFRDCEISRIDAHEGFFNVEVIDCVIGHTFHAIGGGDLYVENMVRLTGNNYIVTRGDYGGSFEGTMTIKNGELKGYSAYNTSVWYQGNKALNESIIGYTDGFILRTGYELPSSDPNQTYYTWNFGYDCYMPETITLIGSFKSGIENIYVSYNDYHDYYTVDVPQLRAEDPDYHAYALTKYLVYQDWEGERIPINRHAENAGNENDYMASYIQIVEN